MSISVVLPTFDRAEALAVTLAPLLALERVAEVVVVDDGSRDATPAILARCSGPRLRVVRHERNRGAPAARNSGARAARGSWVLFAEDDCAFPPDFARVLAEDALAAGADVAGAPMVHPRGRALAVALREARSVRAGDGGLDDVAGFPAGVVETPLLPAPSLVRRALVLRLGFDEGYRGNAYREETDFFIRAARGGARCILTPRTYFWEAGRWSGGQARPALATEWWTVCNNWRFLRRHGDWLAHEGLIDSPLREQARFIGRRARRLAATARAHRGAGEPVAAPAARARPGDGPPAAPGAAGAGDRA